MGQLDGKVAFITGAARGQGRSHAIRLAQEGADIVAVDICKQIDSVSYPLATPDDLAETAELVESFGRKIVAQEADVRDTAAINAAVAEGVARLGRLDIVCANAGIATFGAVAEMSDEMWDDMIDVNLSGVFKTIRAAVPHLKRNERGGVIVVTSSVAGLRASQNLGHYSAAKHGLGGLIKALSIELAPFNIRVNTVNPTSVNTDMIHNQHTYDMFRPDLPEGTATSETVGSSFARVNLIPGVKWVEAADVSNAVLWLVSDAARYVTGVQLPVDAGAVLK
jgi:SDR family mycofactocin-dependent oxidoreductase